MTTNSLQPTSWLAKRLGLSVSTIERLRARGEGQFPPHLVIGRHTIRYDVAVVEEWLTERQHGRTTAPVSRPPSATTSAGKTLFRKRLSSAPASTAQPPPRCQ